MAKIFQTLRNNWKKSIVFSGALVYGVNYGKDRWKENELMRKFAKGQLISECLFDFFKFSKKQRKI